MKELTNSPMQITMVAAENGALPGLKAGGIADVVRDSAAALAARGHHVVVITPSYGLHGDFPEAEHLGKVRVRFRKSDLNVGLWRVMGPDRLEHWLLDAPDFSRDVGKIYYSDPAPFERDATRFALLCAAAAQLIMDEVEGLKPDVVHLHDWHAGLLLVLRAYFDRFAALRDIPMAFTIHNLAYQGIRPGSGYPSSLQSWFGKWNRTPKDTIDPRYSDCINPMLAGINLADAVHVVSPTYAREVLRPSDPVAAVSGGEGLELSLNTANEQGRLHGILNGCDYSKAPPSPLGWSKLLRQLEKGVKGLKPSSTKRLASKRLQKLAKAEPPGVILTSVSRVTEQKALLLRSSGSDGRSGLEAILDRLEEHDGVYFFLGSGEEKEWEDFLIDVSERREDFVFLRGFSERMAKALYASGDLFVMPSAWEPCGISQMLSMRAGQPPLVSRVGGLIDTVTHDVDGFQFGGDSVADKIDNLGRALSRALELRRDQRPKWRSIVANARSKRFLWRDSVIEYEKKLYGGR